MVKLTKVEARIILDSRLKETIEVSLFNNNFSGTASVPAGKSTGEHEAKALPAQEALEKISSLEEKLIQKDFSTLEEFDNFLISLDNTFQKTNLGSNTTLALSIAFLRLLAQIKNQALYQTIAEITGNGNLKFPHFFVNVINGGLHVEEKYHPLPFQEYMIVPESSSPKESLALTFKFIDRLREEVKIRQAEIDLGDEGGFIITGSDPEEGLKILQNTIDSFGGTDKYKIALDIAASSFWDKENKKYVWQDKTWTSEDLKNKYLNLITKYPILSIEDPFEQEAWDDWQIFRAVVGNQIWVIGDDLTVTNTKRIQETQEQKAANAVIVKPNQIGTITETIEAIKLAKSYGWKIIVSHRSGETMDDFIADLSFAVGADGIKAGSPLQKERLVKYQRLIEIEKSLALDE